MSTILLIDDDQDSQNIYSTVLRDNKYTVLQALDGKTGYNQAKESKPDLILLDIMLPGKMNGFDFLEMHQKDPELKHIPVVILSNVDTEEKTARNIGAVDYLVKVNTPMELLLQKVEQYTANTKKPFKLPLIG